MSRMIWLSIFSGFSALEMRSLMFDLSRVESFWMMPMSGLRPARGDSGQRPDLLDVARRGELHALDGRLQLVEVERLQLQRVAQDQLALLEPVRAVDHVGGVELEQG